MKIFFSASPRGYPTISPNVTGGRIPVVEPGALAQRPGRLVLEKPLYFLLGAILVVKRDIERLSACIYHFIIIRELPSVLTEMDAVVLLNGIQHSS